MMNKDYKVQGVSKFRDYKPGNMIKVQTTDKREFKGVYVGTVFYTVNKIRPEGRGFYLVVYDITVHKAKVINILEYCQEKHVHIENVGGTRLVKELSEYLRKYYRDLEQYQELLRQKLEVDKKAELSRTKLEKLALKGVSMDAATSKRLKEEMYQQDPFSRIKATIKTENVGFSVQEGGNDVLFLHHYYSDVQTDGATIGASTYLEYDDVRFVDEEPKPEKIVQHLRDSGYPGADLELYKKIVKKYAKIVEITGDFFMAGLREGKGDRFTISIMFYLEFKDPRRLKVEQLDQLAKDLKTLYDKVTKYNEPRRRGFYW